MRVAYDVTTVMGHSGIEVHTRDLLKHLSVLDPDLQLVLLGRRRHEQELRNLVGPRHDVRAVMPHGLLLGPMLQPVTRLIQRQIWVANTHDVDLVHFTGLTSWTAPARRSVATIHDLFPLMPDMGATAKNRRAFPRQIGHLIDHATRIMVPSNYVASSIAEFYPDVAQRVRVVHHAQSDTFMPLPLNDVTRDRLGLPRDSPYLFFVGRVDARKNLVRMLEAWSTLPTDLRQHNRFVLVLSGRPADINMFSLEHGALMNDPSVIRLYSLATEDVVRLYSGARALAFASIAEGFGLPILEAMSCGCPVITSNRTSLPEVAGDAALLVDPYDVDSIAAAMQQIMTDDVLVEQLRARGFARAAMFSFEATARATYDVYREAVA